MKVREMEAIKREAKPGCPVREKSTDAGADNGLPASAANNGGECWELRRQGAAAAKAAERKKTALLRRLANFLGNTLFALLLGAMVFLVFTMVQSRFTGESPSLAGYQLYIVQGGSMTPTFEAGSLALLRPVDPAKVTAGDIITYRSVGGSANLTTHHVMAVHGYGEALSFTTRGDANQVDDHQAVYPENIVGQVVYTIPYAGYLLSFGQSKTGIITLVFIPGVLILVFELRNLFRLAAQWEEEKGRKLKAKGESFSEEA